MSNKAIGIISYITLIGWIIAFILHRSNEERSAAAGFHIEQALGLLILGLIFSVAFTVLAFIPFLGLLILPAWLGFFVLWLLGLINAIQEKQEPIPLVGAFFQGKFDFINN